MLIAAFVLNINAIMTYSKIYNRIVNRAKDRKLDLYTEAHHVKPKCMGGSDDKTNLVNLTPEEHYICHLLLAKMYPKNEGLAFAAIMMSGNKKRNNKAYGWLKKNLSEAKKKPKAVCTCKQCGKVWKTFPSHAYRQFCSRKCRGLNDSHEKVTLNCNCCSKKYQVMPYRKEKSRFCSRSCYDKRVSPVES